MFSNYKCLCIHLIGPLADFIDVSTILFYVVLFILILINNVIDI